jgi:hypothetical protein
MPFSPFSSFTDPVSLRTLLPRVQSKIESRTRRPWYDLQRSYYFKSKSGIHSITELAAALQHFHVSLSSNEIEFLYQSYPSSTGGFDFRSFASSLYPKDESPQSVLIAKDGLAERKQQIENASKVQPTTATQIDEEYVIVDHEQVPPVEQSQHVEPKNQEKEAKKKNKTKTKTNKSLTSSRLTFGTRSPVLSSSLRHPLVKRYPVVETSPYPPQEFTSHGKYSSTTVNPRFAIKRK